MITPEHPLPEMKACPFCNEKTELAVEPDVDETDPSHIFAYHVACQTCGAKGRNTYRIGWCESHHEAIEAWNDRPDHAVEPVLFARDQYTIEPHGSEGEFALYYGRSAVAHGLRLCQLSDFDRNGERVRYDIKTALNNNAADAAMRRGVRHV